MHGYMMQDYMFLFWAASIGRARHRRGNSSSNAMGQEARRFLAARPMQQGMSRGRPGKRKDRPSTISPTRCSGDAMGSSYVASLRRGVALITFRLTPGSARVAAHSGHGRK